MTKSSTPDNVPIVACLDSLEETKTKTKTETKDRIGTKAKTPKE